jgi:SSS family solute:Na+ symporter
MLTPPESDAHLVAFYRRTRPDGPGWTRIAALAGGPPPGRLRGLLIDWAAGVVLVYAALFATGHALLGSGRVALLCVAAAVGAIAVLLRRSGSRSAPSV